MLVFDVLGDSDYLGKNVLEQSKKLKKLRPYIALSSAWNRTRAAFEI